MTVQVLTDINTGLYVLVTTCASTSVTATPHQYTRYFLALCKLRRRCWQASVSAADNAAGRRYTAVAFDHSAAHNQNVDGPTSVEFRAHFF
jgi:hypothetical protein